MTKLVNLLGRKPALAAEKPSGSPEPKKSDMELDQELFFPLATQLTARRTQIADLQRRVQQQGSDLQITRDENRRVIERAATADKRAVQLEGQTQAAQQKAMLAEKERVTVQAAHDKALNEFAQV